MNAYEKSQQLQLEGTDAEQVAVIKGLLKKPVPIASLRQYLRDNGMLLKTRDGWAGTLAEVQDSNIDALVDALDDPRQETISTHEPRWGAAFITTVNGLVAGGLLTQDQADAVLTLGGGLAYPDLTVEQFAEQREVGEALQLKQDALDLITNTAYEAAAAEYRSADGTPDSIKQAALDVINGGV